MAWTTPKTFSQGELVTPDHLNTHLRDNTAELRAGGVAISGQAANRIPYASSATQLATSANLAFDGDSLTVGGEVQLTANNASAGVGSIAKVAENGFQIRPVTGSSYDFSLVNAANTLYVFRVPTGTNQCQPIGIVMSGPVQPGFLAYNSANDASVAHGATIDFDTEAYDLAGNFAADTFTAPVTGYYLLSANVGMTPDSSGSWVGADLVIAGTSAATYRLGQVSVEGVVDTLGVGNSLVVHMTATDTAKVTLVSTDSTVLVLGGATPRVTWFSGRLLV